MNWKAEVRRIRDVIERNLLLKTFSLVFAVGLWAFVNLGARDAEKTLSAPVELRNVPAAFVVTSPLVDAVDVRVRGPRTILGTIDERRLRILLNLENVRPGPASFKVDPEMLALPRGVTVTRLSPVQVTLEVERLMKRMLPVALGSATAIPDGYRLAESQIRPRMVSVSGPITEVRELQGLTTSSLSLRAATTTFEESVTVERPSNLVRVTPERVVFRGRLEEIVISRDFPKVGIGVRNGDGEARLEPSLGDVTLRGPQRILEQFEPTGESLFVDVGGLAPGNHKLQVQSQLPEGVEVAKVQPTEVSVKIASGESSPAEP